MRVGKWLALAGAVGGLVLGSAASAAIIVIPIDTGPFSLPAHPAGVIPVGTYFEGTNTYDLTFTTVGGIYDTTMHLQGTPVGAASPSGIAFALFRGAPGSGSFVADSAGTPSLAALRVLVGGSYYLEVDTVSAPRESVGSGITLLAAAPEPEGWALMLLGVAGLGAALRRERGSEAA